MIRGKATRMASGQKEIPGLSTELTGRQTRPANIKLDIRRTEENMYKSEGSQS